MTKAFPVAVVLLFLGSLAAAAGDDERDSFTATFFTGASVDSFAAQELKNYVYPSESGDKRLGYAAGVDFGYRLAGKQAESKRPQLWIYGETVHGQRSADVDCSAEPKPEACSLQGLTPTPGAFIGILRNASSLEALAGLRLELLTLQAGIEFASKMYVKSELGFMTITGSGGDVVDSNQHLAVGALATNGRFGGSYLEAGWGKTDLFRLHRGRRVKFDGYLTWDFSEECKGTSVGSWMKCHGMQPFIQMTVDSDFGAGADSVRTYYGFNFDLKKLWSPGP